MVLWKDNLKFRYLAFSLSPAMDTGRGLSFEQAWIPFVQGCFVPRVAEIGPVSLEEKYCYMFLQCILTILFHTPWKRLGLICSNLNSLHPSRFCAKFRWNWPIGSWEDYFCNLVTLFVYEKILFKFVGVFLLFRNYLFLEKIVTPFHLYRSVFISGEGL